jgi:hypothetical protein
MWWGFKINTVWALILVISSYYLTAQGAVGLAKAFLISYLIQLIIIALFTFKTMRKLEKKHVQ